MALARNQGLIFSTYLTHAGTDFPGRAVKRGRVLTFAVLREGTLSTLESEGIGK